MRQGDRLDRDGFGSGVEVAERGVPVIGPLAVVVVITAGAWQDTGSCGRWASDRGKGMSNPAFKFDHVHIISQDPHASARWYVEMLGARIARDTVARGAPQIFVELGGMTILIRGKRPGEDPAPTRPIRPYADFSSHNG
jgi:hypothetical protein